jgi:membrane protein implicated in regulation of membrane protease activity
VKSVIARVFGMLSAALAIIGLVRLLQGQAGFGAAFLFAAFVSVVVSYALVRSVNASRQRPAGQRRPDAQPGRGDDRRR